MAQTVYAATPYSQDHPIDYLEFKGIININGIEVADKTNFWDAWLLDDYLKRHRNAYGNESPEWEMIKTNCLKEANIYNNIGNKNAQKEIMPSNY